MPPKDFSPFPHGTCTLSVLVEFKASRMVPRFSHRRLRATCFIECAPEIHRDSRSTGLSPSLAMNSIIFEMMGKLYML